MLTWSLCLRLSCTMKVFTGLNPRDFKSSFPFVTTSLLGLLQVTGSQYLQSVGGSLQHSHDDLYLLVFTSLCNALLHWTGPTSPVWLQKWKCAPFKTRSQIKMASALALSWITGSDRASCYVVRTLKQTFIKRSMWWRTHCQQLAITCQAPEWVWKADPSAPLSL